MAHLSSLGKEVADIRRGMNWVPQAPPKQTLRFEGKEFKDFQNLRNRQKGIEIIKQKKKQKHHWWEGLFSQGAPFISQPSTTSPFLSAYEDSEGRCS